jgi:hypothetical protein
MKTVFITLVIYFLDLGAWAADDQDEQFDHSIWLSWKEAHNKHYEDQFEEEEHLTHFKRRVNFVNAHNDLHAKGKAPFKLAVYQYADLSRKEFLEARTGFKIAK